MIRSSNGQRARGVERVFFGAGAAAALAAAATGCLQILGDEGPFVLATGGSAGAGGTGADGGAGGTVSACEPGTNEPCYDGPEETLGVGLCKGGTHTCGQDGTWGKCTGQVQPGVETCASKDDEDCDGNECARWSLMSGGDGGMGATALATDPEGNIVVAGGVFDGQATLGDKTVDGPLMLAKLSSSGKPQWVKSFGGSNVQFALPKSTACDTNGNIFVGGFFEATLDLPSSILNAKGRDVFVLKLAPGGAEAWARGLGGDMDQDLWQMTLTSNGDPLLTGTYSNGFQFGGSFVNGAGAFVVRLSSSDGGVASVKHFDTLAGAFVSPAVAAGPDGTWVLSGRCGDGASIDMQILPTCNNFIAKFAADDSLLWAVNIPALPVSLAVVADGSIVLGGHFSGSIDFGLGPTVSQGKSDIFVAKMTANGSIQWNKTFGSGPGDEYLSQLIIDTQGRGHVVLSSDTDVDLGGGTLKNSGFRDVFVLSLDISGNHRWSRVFGDATLETGLLLAFKNRDDGLVISINTPGGLNFGAGALQATAPLALAIAELGP